jgi:ABC-type thiamine transport system substrate-binding protein
VRADVTVPADYVAFTAKVTPGKTVSPADIDANRDAWIAQWTKIVLS